MPGSLDGLRDIHLPEAVSWWPLAYGYWIAVALLLGVCVLWLRRYRRFAVRRAARRELNSLASGFDLPRQSLQLARAVNVMLRRTVLSLQPRHEVAALTGEQWIERLHACVAGSGFEFSEAAQRVLTKDIYKANTDVDGENLLAECRRWIAELPPKVVA